MVVKNFKKNMSKGFTLVEMLVAVAIFSLIMLVALAAVLSIVGANKKGQALSSVINNLNFALESMNRDLRTGEGYDCPSPCKQIEFKSSQFPPKVRYTFDETKHTITKTKSDSGGNFGASTPTQMISDEVFIENMEFDLKAPLGEQPRILLVIKGCAAANRQPTPDGLGNCDESDSNISLFSLQTLLTQRKLELP